MACVLSACASEGLSPTAAAFAPTAVPAGIGLDPQSVGTTSAGDTYDDNALFAGRATYRCDSGESLQVDNTVTRIAIAQADGTVMELPASPSDSHTRYVKDQYAFVFDGEEALFFRPKTAPATCRR